MRDASPTQRGHSARPSRTSSSQHLDTINESANTPITPPIPRRSSRRLSGSPAPPPWSRRVRLPFTGRGSSQDTERTAPPAYDWVPEPPLDGEDTSNGPVEGEKLAKLRRDEGWRRPRGGWGRLVLVAAVVLVVFIALAVGLGVGLSQKKKSKTQSSSETSGGSSGSNLPPQKFPLGQYSMVTALTTVQTYCTSNPATWRCYPFTTYTPTDSSTADSSLAYFNWIIRNTTADYATLESTSSTSDSGIPAGLTVTSANDPFGIEFGEKPLTYIASSSNSTSSRYTFSFTMSKMTVPSPTISSDNSATVCFFNETIFSGTIYLSAPRTYPSGSSSNSQTVGGYEQWPHAVEVTQTAYGGQNVPNCYEYVDGNVGAPITASLTPEASNFGCLCDYRNNF